MSYRDMKPVITLRQYCTPMHSLIKQEALNSFFVSQKSNEDIRCIHPQSGINLSPRIPAVRLPANHKGKRCRFADHSYLRERLRPNPELLKWLHICSLNSTTSFVGSGLKTQMIPAWAWSPPSKHGSFSSSNEYSNADFLILLEHEHDVVAGHLQHWRARRLILRVERRRSPVGSLMKQRYKRLIRPKEQQQHTAAQSAVTCPAVSAAPAFCFDALGWSAGLECFTRLESGEGCLSGLDMISESLSRTKKTLADL